MTAMVYMRIQRNKFWGWVVASLLVGVLAATGIGYALGGSTRSELARLRSAETSSTAGVQAQLQSAEASVTALQSQNASLASQLASAQAAAERKTSTSTTTTTTTSAIAVVSRTISPSTMTTAGSITMTVHVTGHPDTVKMRIYNASKSIDKTYVLTRTSTSGNAETWRLTVNAPSTKGTYSYYATATKGSSSVTKTGASPSQFTVD